MHPVHLNPHNRGHGFYVYGTLPLFLTRYIVEWIYGHSGFQEMTNVGRPLSALADLLTVLLVYIIAARIYDRRVGIIAAAFSSVVVLQIQLSHYFTVDTFLNFFTYLAIYFSVRVTVK
jgi:dolichyl-phosphate-mannose--protein O-mannosyl transferase